ncbi:outer membrane protein [Sphingomonas sp.]|jgi:outer membrane immunogenic protein|uniref:outer membrane protein n=1 Tax=Sphingomonas sp. TaxID=28214 RepID=UPI002D804BAE|nr:outer membrane beta-barrel protein [Sphingomonas sp.]HEU0044480.1 outer membrane beta-barrel protein [Sphingomonas sp.]
MMTKKLALFTAAAVAAVAAPAAAQDETGRMPFDGVYVGVSGGYDVQNNNPNASIVFDRNNDGSFTDTVSTAAGANAFSPGFCDGQAVAAARGSAGCANDRDGWSYYGRVGVDKQMGAFVIGLVGEFGKTEIRDYTSGFSTTPANYVFERSIDWEASAGLRAGLAADQTLFYGVGKFGYARIDHRFSTTNTANSFTTTADDRDRKGYIVGGGIEQRIGRALSIGLEYSYHNYKDDDYNIFVGQGTAPATNPFVLAPNTAGTNLRRSDDRFRWHSLRATVGLRF